MTDKPVLTRRRIPTLQQTRFVQELLKQGGNAKSAALSAGYDETSAKYPGRILASEAVKQELQIANQKLQAQLEIDFKYKYAKLKRIVEYYVPDEGELKNDGVKIAITALAEMNKMSGDYAPDKRLSLTVDHTQGKILEARKQYKEY